MEVTDAICTKHKLYTSMKPLTPQGIVIHSIGCPQPDASVLRNNWNRNTNGVIAHYVLDDGKILRCLPDNCRAAHIGSPGNGMFLGIEMCEPKQIRYTSGAVFTCSDHDAAAAFVTACYNNCAELCAKLCLQYGWTPEEDIFSHFYFTSNGMYGCTHVDPEHLWNGLEMGYTLNTFRAEVRARMGQTADAGTTQETAAADSETAVTLPTLARGSRGSAVKSLQALLNGKAGEQLDTDGSFGSLTEAAVTRYCGKGSCDTAVWKRLLTG